MKAMVVHGPNQPFVAEQRPDPVPGPREAVARVICCGAGLTVQHAKVGRARIDYPRILGHEITGEIVAVGGEVDTLAVGDAVTAYFYLTCGTCHWCGIDRETLCENYAGQVGRDIDGGYAELIKLPARNFIRLPEALDYRARPAEAAVVCDAVATPVKVIKRARVRAPDTVAVFGAGGGLGIHMLMVTRLHGVRTIAVETRAEKFAACREAGADAVVGETGEEASAALRELTGGRGIDVAIDFVSSTQTLETAIAALGRGGRLVTLGGAGEPFRAHARDLLHKELELMGSRYATHGEVAEALELVASGAVKPLVTEVGTLDDLETIHQRLEQGLVTGRAAVMVAPR